MGRTQTNAAPQGGNQRLEYLDAARGLAALTVVCSHFVCAYNVIPELSFTWDSIFRFWYDGFAAVSFFFVLSGYVLSRKYVQAQAAPVDKTVQLRSFMVTRFFRIYMPYICILLLHVCLQAFHVQRVLDLETVPASTGWQRGFWSDRITWLFLLKQANLLGKAAPDFKPMPQAWSLQVEVGLSLFLPIFLLILRQGIDWVFFFIAVGGCVIGSTHGLSFFNFHFIAGIVLAKTEAFHKAWWQRQHAVVKIAFVAAAFFVYSARYSFYTPFVLTYLSNARDMFLVTGLGSAMLLLAILCSPKIQHCLSHPVLTFFGKISYSVYLTHTIVLTCVVPPAYIALNRMGLKQSSLCWVIGLVCEIVGTIGLSYVTYKVVELPCLRLGKCVNRRLNSLRGNNELENVFVELPRLPTPRPARADGVLSTRVDDGEADVART